MNIMLDYTASRVGGGKMVALKQLEQLFQIKRIRKLMMDVLHG